MFIKTKNIRTVVLFALLFLIAISVATVLAAANIVPITRLTDQNRSILASELAPPECNSIRNSLESYIACSSTPCSGSPGNRNDLILGTPGDDIIDGGNGDDCIVGGGGNDIIFGDHGDDVLVGGPGVDTLDGGDRKKDTDTCVDDGGTTFIDCEIIQ